MAETKKSNDKTRRVLNIMFACIAIGALIATVLLSPFGKRLLKKEETTAVQTEAQTESAVSTTKPVIPEENSQNTGDNSSASSAKPSVSVPPSTDPSPDIYKNYSIFIDKRTFDYTENQGVTTLVAKNNKQVTVTVTPHKDMSYTQLCTEVKKSHEQLPADKKLKLENLNTAFSTENGNIITTVYCIDDGKGGSIELKTQLPTNEKDYNDDITLILSMFTVK